MANLTSTTITGTLNTTSTITGPASGASALNASNVSSGTLSSDRLPTVPTTKGGTGLTSVGSAGQVLKVNPGGTALEFGEAGGGGGYNLLIYTSPATYTPPASLKNVKVSVVAGGGGGGHMSQTTSMRAGGDGGAGGASVEEIAYPFSPQPITVGSGGVGRGTNAYQPGGSGGTSSFGTYLSATGGSGGGNFQSGGADGNAGTGSGGQFNSGPITPYQAFTQSAYTFGGPKGACNGVNFGFGAYGFKRSPDCYRSGVCAAGCGGGARGNLYAGNNSCSGAGGGGIVVVEEFF